MSTIRLRIELTLGPDEWDDDRDPPPIEPAQAIRAVARILDRKPVFLGSNHGRARWLEITDVDVSLTDPPPPTATPPLPS